MSSFQEIIRKSVNTPYHHPVRVKVLGSSREIKYGSEGKMLKNVAMSDGTSSFKALCFDSSKFTHLEEGNGLVLRNVILKSQEMIITKQTKIYLTSAPDIHPDLAEEGKRLICIEKAETVDIDAAKSSPKKTRISIRGQVVNEGMKTSVLSNNKEVDIKTVTVSDLTGQIDITLWRNHSDQILHVGDFVQMSNVVVNDYKSDITLNTTQYTEIEIIEAPDENFSVKILGYSEVDGHYELITEGKGTFTVSKDIFAEHCVPNELPKVVNVTANGKTIKDIY